jgi:hypothetical protein
VIEGPLGTAGFSFVTGSLVARPRPVSFPGGHLAPGEKPPETRRPFAAGYQLGSWAEYHEQPTA